MLLPSPLVGRVEELSFLLGALSEDSGHGLVLAGAAGVGKTRLAREVLAVASARGRVTLWVSASSAAATIPFGALAPLFPEHDSGDQLRFLRRAGSWLREANDGIPVVGVDDAHLLDDASAALVGQLVGAGDVVVVATIRSGEPAPGPVTGLWKDGLCERVELQPLARSETLSLIEALLEGPVDAVTLELLWRLSRGNALYLREMIDGGLTSGALHRQEGVWCWSGPVVAAPRLAELVATRIDGQPNDVRRLLDLVSFGEPLAVTMLERTGISADSVDKAERAGLVRTEYGRTDVLVRLGHPMFGEVVRSAASALQHRTVCRSLALASAGDVVDPVRVGVWHLDGALAADPSMLLAGARRALAVLDLPLGRRLAQAAVDAGGGLEAERTSATIHVLSGDADDAEELLAGLDDRELTDPTRAELAAMRAWNLTFALGRPDDATAVLDAAHRRVARGWEVIACQRASLLGYAGDPVRAGSVVARVLERPGPSDDATVQALALTCQMSSVHGQLEAAIAAGERSVVLHRELHNGDRSQKEEEVLGALAAVNVFAGRLGAAQALVDAGLERSQAAGWQVGGTAMWTMWQGDIALARGMPRSALRHFRAASARGSSHPYDEVVTRRRMAHLRARAAAHLGDVDDATEALADADRRAVPWLGLLDVWGGSSAAWVAAARGEIENGVRLALAAADRARGDEQFTFELAARHQVVRFGAPGRVVERIVELGQQVDGLLAAPSVKHAVALTAGDGAGLDGVAATFADLGYLLLGADAAAHAAQAHRAAGRLGRALASEGRARDLHSRCESARTPALALLGGPTGLTRRETEIARLAASGLTNRSIAEKLVISVRTVDNALHQTYAKLGITGRGELPSIFGAPDSGGPGTRTR